MIDLVIDEAVQADEATCALPPDARRQAPTRNPEYGAYACSRASQALSSMRCNSA